MIRTSTSDDEDFKLELREYRLRPYEKYYEIYILSKLYATKPISVPLEIFHIICYIFTRNIQMRIS